jgi:hypothetical protein
VAFAAPCARGGFGGLELLQLRKPRPHGLFDEPATLPRRYESPHLVQEGVFEEHIHARHQSTSIYTQQGIPCVRRQSAKPTRDPRNTLEMTHVVSPGTSLSVPPHTWGREGTACDLRKLPLPDDFAGQLPIEENKDYESKAKGNANEPQTPEIVDHIAIGKKP